VCVCMRRLYTKSKQAHQWYYNKLHPEQLPAMDVFVFVFVFVLYANKCWNRPEPSLLQKCPIFFIITITEKQ